MSYNRIYNVVLGLLLSHIYFFYKTKKCVKHYLVNENILMYEDLIHDEKYKIKFQGFQLVGAGTIWNSLGFRYSVKVGQRKLTVITTLSGICFLE